MPELTKQQAARRLIHAAVTMSDAGADPLATHVVASSAFNMLRELSKVDGAHFTVRVYQFSLYNAALSRVKGEDHGLPHHPVSEAWIDGIAKAIVSGGVKGPEDITIKDAQKTEFETFRYLVGPFNFLKHADKDPLETLDEGAVKPIEVISFAVTAYGFLFPDDELIPEIMDFLVKNGAL